MIATYTANHPPALDAIVALAGDDLRCRRWRVLQVWKRPTLRPQVEVQMAGFPKVRVWVPVEEVLR